MRITFMMAAIAEATHITDGQQQESAISAGVITIGSALAYS